MNPTVAEVGGLWRLQRSYLRRIDSCNTQLKAQGPSSTYDESKDKKKSSVNLRSMPRFAPAAAEAAFSTHTFHHNHRQIDKYIHRYIYT